MRSNLFFTAATALALSAMATAASANCTRLGFTVNDYGKDGPTNDAKMLLDKYIAKWAAEHGVKKYTTGKKEVSCELFIDVGLFDEHTCKAMAKVCWASPSPAADAAAVANKEKDKAAAKAVAKTAATKPKG